jgi:hypothetical protein
MRVEEKQINTHDTASLNDTSAQSEVKIRASTRHVKTTMLLADVVVKGHVVVMKQRPEAENKGLCMMHE